MNLKMHQIMAQEEAVSAILSAMEEYSQLIDIQDAALGALRNLAANPEQQVPTQVALVCCILSIHPLC